MLLSASFYLSVLLYIGASALLIKAIVTSESTSATPPRSYLVACLAVIFHLIYLREISFPDLALNLSLSSMAVLVSGLVTLIFVAAGLVMPIRRLGVIVFPITITCLIFSELWPSPKQLLGSDSVWLASHIVVSLLAYSLITIATIQALIYWYQDRQIKAKKEAKLLNVMPPLQTMDSLWFRLTLLGFGFLTLALASGAFFSQEIFGAPFAFKHHIVLTICGWLVFALLLSKRLSMGLRGLEALVWTGAGFLFIQLGYFGTKLVSESLLP